jgi:hypothetical protein
MACKADPTADRFTMSTVLILCDPENGGAYLQDVDGRGDSKIDTSREFARIVRILPCSLRPSLDICQSLFQGSPLFCHLRMLSRLFQEIRSGSGERKAPTECEACREDAHRTTLRSSEHHSEHVLYCSEWNV